MLVERPVTLIFDPFGISVSPGLHVSDYRSELAAFREIDRRLLADRCDESFLPLTVIVNSGSLGHFRVYRGLRGVQIDDLTPTRHVAEIIGSPPPPWLTDKLIHQYGLLGQKAPPGIVQKSWEATVQEWLIPGITSALTLGDWFRAAGLAPALAATNKCEPLATWAATQFADLCSPKIASGELISDITTALRNSPSPAAFAREWAKRVALLPLVDSKADNTLRLASLDPVGPRERILAKQLPLVFPLPAALHAEVSRHVTEAIRRARNSNYKGFENAAMGLNALWDGVADELMAWLVIYPQGMTSRTLEHIRDLPGYSADDQFGQAVVTHAPLPAISPWTGCDEAFDSWVSAYASWARSAFVRRELPREDDDPAKLFSRWYKDNHTVSFAHAERSYLTIAGRVRNALRKGRTVILVVVDAMAVHVADVFREAITKHLTAEPTYCSHVFGPVPTVTEVCKGAILCGQFPDRCSSDLADDLCQAYQLRQEQLSIASNWDDAERVRVSPHTQMLVYRENRLDDYLSSTGNYKELLSDATTLAARVGGLVRRLVDDLRCVTGSVPLVVLTADHGFTYGPKPGSESKAHRPLDGAHRCLPIVDPQSSDLCDESLTFIDATLFHTRSSYLAARGRVFGSGTISGWKLSHGGLLPEEVIIPVFEWFGEEAPVHWPKLESIGEATRDRAAWVFQIRLQNVHSVPLFGGDLIVCLAGDDSRATRQFSRLQPGQVADLKFQLKTDCLGGEGSTLRLDTATTISLSADRQHTIQRLIQIPKTRQLSERTADQDAFESMF